MRTVILSVVSTTLLTAFFCAVAPTPARGETEVKVPLDKVPEVVKEAARKAVPGIVLTAAYKEVERGKTVYELKGKVGDKKYEIEVTPQGKVLEVEKDDDDD